MFNNNKKRKSMKSLKRFEEVKSYFVKKDYVVNKINDDMIFFNNVEWKDYNELEGYGDICCVDIDYDYMNRTFYV